MSTHVVIQGDCLASIAKQYGFRDWQSIYNHASNQAFRAKRPNPNVLFPGDQLTIPDIEKKEEDKPVDNKHKFKVKGRRTYLRLLIEEFDGTGLAGKKYKLDLGGEVFEGSTGGGGLVEHEIAADAADGEITVWLDAEQRTAVFWPLTLGALDPYDEAPGTPERLNNLGYDNLADGTSDERTENAIKAFQKANGIAESGAVDAATKGKAKTIYGF